MRLKYLALLMVVLIFASVGHGAAQNTDEYSMRDLASQNDFYIGAAVYASHLDDPTHRDVLSQQFNMLTPENEAKMCEVQPQQGVFDFTNFDVLMDFAEEHNMVVRGHTLVWHQCVPDWLLSGDFGRDEAIQLLREHIMATVGRYKGRIFYWDVVNEGITDDGAGLRDTPWRQLIGDDYIDLAFQFAHEADPEAKLFYNDYGADGINAKSDAIYALVQDMLDRGIPIHGIGLQAHISVGSSEPNGSISPETLGENIRRFGELGLEVHITELDVNFRGESNDMILGRQAGDYRRVLETCLDSEYCTALVTWGVADHLSWLRYWESANTPNAEPLLFDSNYQPKPAYVAVVDLLARHAGLEPILSDEEIEQLLAGQTIEVDIPEPIKSDPTQLSPDSADGAVYYAPFPINIILDGNADDWANIPQILVDRGPMLPSDGTTLTFAVAADDTYMYFLADVQDNTIVYGNYVPESGWYREDSVEFYINATGNLAATSYEDGIVQLGILASNITNPDIPILGGSNSSDTQARVVAVETDDGYLIEAAVPLVTEIWNIQPSHLGVLGFQAHLNGASSDDRDAKLIWSIYDTQDQSWTNPSVFGQLIFWDINR